MTTILAKQSERLSYKAGLLLIAYVFFNVASTVILKIFMQKYPQVQYDGSDGVLVVAGLMSYITSIILMIFLLGRGALTLIYPVTISVSIIMFLLAGFFFFHEILILTQWVAMGIIGLGLFFLLRG